MFLELQGTMPLAQRSDAKEIIMLRLSALLLLGYVSYRVGKSFIDSVPDDFDPLFLPLADNMRAAQRKRRSSAAAATAA